MTSVANGWSYQYDANGNMIYRDENSEYTQVFDVENRLAEVWEEGDLVAAFTYDGGGNRVKRVADGVTTVYVGNYYEVQGGEVTKYYYVNGQRIAMRVGDEFNSHGKVIGQVGQFTNALTDEPHTVILDHSYENPVVFAQPLSYNGSNPALVRVTDVESDRFTLYIEEPPDQDGIHTEEETVSYVVLEAGSWELSDGTLLEVGTLTTNKTVGKNVSNSQWVHVSFGSSFSATPVVLSQVQTENDAHFVSTRQRNGTATGFDVALEEDEAQTMWHASETIGWLAIEAGSGNWSGHAYKAASTADSVTHDWYQINFGQSIDVPRFLASLASYNGPDNAHLRRGSLTSGGVQVMVEEDTTWDTEMEHINAEVVNYLALGGDGYLTVDTVPGDHGGTLTFLHGDHLGSTSLATDASGAKVSRVLYYPYGETRWTDGTLPTDYQYTGQRAEDFGLYDYHARYYDGAIGRFISADTVVPHPGNPQSLNRYSYVLGNPVRYTDSSGHAIDMYRNSTYGVVEYPLEQPPSPERVRETALFVTEAIVAVVALPVVVADVAGLGYYELVQLSAKCLTSPICGAVVYGISQEAADGDDTEAQLARTAYEIGEEGEDLVFEYLKDPTLQREVGVYVNEAGRRANYVARLDGVTETAVHEVKNVANLSLSQEFMNQATTYKRISDGLGVELHYWLVNSAPERVVEWLQDLGAVVHTGVPGQ